MESMNRKSTLESEEPEDPISFCLGIDFLYQQLVCIKERFGKDSSQYEAKLIETRQFVVGFVRKKIGIHPQQAGSYGRDEFGQEKLSANMFIPNPEETILCTWGVKGMKPILEVSTSRYVGSDNP